LDEWLVLVNVGDELVHALLVSRPHWVPLFVYLIPSV
jgi:hypothetical protein